MKLVFASVFLCLLLAASARELRQATVRTSASGSTRVTGAGSATTRTSTTISVSGPAPKAAAQESAKPSTAKPSEEEDVAGRLDVYCLVDLTESATNFVKQLSMNAGKIVNSTFDLSPLIRFGVGTYKDVDGESTFANVQAVTKSKENATSALIGLSAVKGNSPKESQFSALQSVATSDAIKFRTKSQKIVVWIGNAEGKDSSDKASENAVIDALQEKNIAVIAIDTGKLDASNQATSVVQATNGIFRKVNADGRFGTTAVSATQSSPSGTAMASGSATGGNTVVRTTIDGQTVETTGGSSKSLTDVIIDSVSALFAA